MRNNQAKKPGFSEKPGFWSTLACIIALTALSGCSSGLLHPHGRVTSEGEVLRGRKGERLLVIMHRLDEGNKELDSFIANIKPEAGFEVHGHHGKGIPPGKYRISVQITNKKGENDRLKGAFGPEKSPFVRDITDDDEEIVVDIGKRPD